MELARRYHLDVPDPRRPSASRWRRCSPTWRTARDPDNLFRIAIALERRAAFLHRACRCGAAGSAEALFLNWPPRGRSTPARSPPNCSAGSRAGRGCSAPAPRAQAGSELGRRPDQRRRAAAAGGHDAERVALGVRRPAAHHGELRDRVARAAAVAARGWRARPPRVAIKLPDGLDWVVAFLGTLWAGGTAVAVNPKIPAPEWHYILDEAGFTVILAESADDTPPPWRDKVVLVDEGRRAVSAASRWRRAWSTPTRRPSGCIPRAPQASQGGGACAPLRPRGRARLAERLGITADDRLFASSRLFSYPADQQPVGPAESWGATVVLDPQWPTARRAYAATVAATRPTVLFSDRSLPPDAARGLARASRRPACAMRIGRRGAAAKTARCLARADRAAWSAATAPPRPWCWCSRPAGATTACNLRRVCSCARWTPGRRRRQPTRLCFRVDMQALGYLDRPARRPTASRDGAFCPADLFVATAGGGGWRFAGREDTLLKIRAAGSTSTTWKNAWARARRAWWKARRCAWPMPTASTRWPHFFVAREGEQAAVEQALRERMERAAHASARAAHGGGHPAHRHRQ